MTSSLLTEVRYHPFSGLFDCCIDNRGAEDQCYLSPRPFAFTKKSIQLYHPNNVGYSGSEQGALDAIASIEADPAPHGFSDIHYYACGQDSAQTLTTTRRSQKWFFSIRRKDHVFADVDENVFLTLDASLDGVQHTAQTGPNLGDITTTNNYVLTVSFTPQKYNGGTFSFPVFSGTMPQSRTFHSCYRNTRVGWKLSRLFETYACVLTAVRKSRKQLPIHCVTSAEIARERRLKILSTSKLFPRRYEGFSVDCTPVTCTSFLTTFCFCIASTSGRRISSPTATRNINFWENVMLFQQAFRKGTIC